MNRGFLVIAQNTTHVDYIKCAAALALSAKHTMPNESITLATAGTVTTEYESYFDNIVQLPYGDLANSEWKLVNDWQVYEASPYEYTIKLEADMFLPKSIDYWWNTLSNRDVVVATNVRNFRQELSTVLAYRRFITDNNLPNCYNAITYFKKSTLAETFFKICKDVFVNWEDYKSFLQCSPTEEATTDWVYAIAAHILGEECTTLPSFTDMSFVHMKRFINDLPSDNWTDTFVYEILPHTLRVNTCPQAYPFHYHVKNFADNILESDYGRKAKRR